MTTLKDHVDDAIALLEVDRLEDMFAIRMCEGEPLAKDQCHERAQWLATFTQCGCEWALCEQHMVLAHAALTELRENRDAWPSPLIRHKPCGQLVAADALHHITTTHL